MIPMHCFERWRGRQPGLMGARAAYAVLVPLVLREGEEPALLFEVRASTLRRQPGEVCFPGGKARRGESPEQCALRETEEELGLPASGIEVIGPMDFICHQSGFLLHPILGKLRWECASPLRPNPAEVAETFLLPVSFFQTPPLVYTYPLEPRVGDDFPYELTGVSRDYPWRGGTVEVPIYRYEGHTIWGLTGRIVHSLFRGLEQQDAP